MEKRKNPRLSGYDYSSTGAYFVTVCVKNRLPLLSVVGRDDPGAPHNIVLSPIGEIAEKYIRSINLSYTNISVDNYVIMPNHVHLLITVSDDNWRAESSRPTVSRVIGAFKRLTNKECGRELWQASFYDHVIRDEQDYFVRWKYIDENPAKWAEDEYF